jgi:hypothetical protein
MTTWTTLINEQKVNETKKTKKASTTWASIAREEKSVNWNEVEEYWERRFK